VSVRTGERLKTSPLITVVIPTKGRPDLLLRAVHSALAQTYQYLEVVVVLDGSDGSTVQALRTIVAPCLRVLVLQPAVGGSEARNRGVQEARGSWIAMLDDDDEWFPDKLEKQLSLGCGEDSPECLITCRRIERSPGNSDVLAPRRLPGVDEDVSEYLFWSHDGKRHTSGPQTSGYLATKALCIANPFTKNLPIHQDWDWYLRARRRETTVSFMLEEPLYIMHVDNSRPRTTRLATWRLSLDWVTLRKDLFTPRAYVSFIINECMFRCEDTHERLRTFKHLSSLCRAAGEMSLTNHALIVKWFVFSPSVRLRVRMCRSRLRMSINRALKAVHPAAMVR
jgi:glycosyltransferase involved in cell wall biosynthesis